jgi:hypothetical protein
MANATSNLQSTGLVNQKPIEKVTLIANPGTEQAEALTVLLNPSKLDLMIKVEWSRLPVVGLDYEVLHYSRTHSIMIPMSFHFSIFEQARQQIGGTPDPVTQMQTAVQSGIVPVSSLKQASIDFVQFLESLGFPTRTGLRPPTVKLYWPNVVSMYCVMDEVKFTMTKFDKTLAPIIYQADVMWIEARTTRRYSEDVRVNGLLDASDPLAPTKL